MPSPRPCPSGRDLAPRAVSTPLGASLTRSPSPILKRLRPPLPVYFREPRAPENGASLSALEPRRPGKPPEHSCSPSLNQPSSAAAAATEGADASASGAPGPPELPRCIPACLGESRDVFVRESSRARACTVCALRSERGVVHGRPQRSRKQRKGTLPRAPLILISHAPRMNVLHSRSTRTLRLRTARSLFSDGRCALKKYSRKLSIITLQAIVGGTVLKLASFHCTVVTLQAGGGGSFQQWRFGVLRLPAMFSVHQ